jgi:hypothetical protein
MWLFLTVALLLFAFLAYRFPRKTLYVLFGMIALLAAVGIYAWIETVRNDRQNARVEIIATYDLSRCSKDKPLFVIVSNGSDRQINRIEWGFSAYAPGTSSNLIDDPTTRPWSDTILRPGWQMTACFALPKLPENVDPAPLRWETEDKYVVFASD